MKLVLALAGIISVAGTSVWADEYGSLKLQLDQKVIYCAARLHMPEGTFSLDMKDGIPMATVWHVQVGKVRDYWLNEDIAAITVVRRAVPDLLTRSWLLVDESSGISRRVYAVQDAIRFLSSLEHFPVIDRSLLLADTLYRVAVNVEIHAGEINEAWWSGLWKSSLTSMQKDFSLP